MAVLEGSTHELQCGAVITIRTATENDAEALLACTNAYIADNDGQVWDPAEFQFSLEQELEWIASLKRNPSELLLIAETDGKVIGNIDFQVGKRTRLAHSGELGLAVSKEWRSLGVGAVLMDVLMRWAKDNPAIEKVNLRVLNTNERAIRLYRKFGFQVNGRMPREIKYADEGYADVVLMSRFV